MKIIWTVNNTADTYTQFILSVKDTLYRLALSLVGCSADAEDIVQDIYERVWRARDKVLSEPYPRAYVCRMTRNLAIDRLRARKESVDQDWGGYTDGYKEVAIRDMAQFTKLVIASLPERQRVAIEMRDVEGYEIEEIAMILECDSSSVRMNISRARKKVREEVLKALSYGDKRH